MSAVAPHWGALLGLTLFLAVGLSVLDDHGVHVDEHSNQWNAIVNIRYVIGDIDALRPAPDLPVEHNIFYGMAFEAPLLLAQRAFGVGDASLGNSRATYAFRHLVTHLFFLAGGLVAYLLAFRLLRSRLLALTAMALLLLHPRLHAHSYLGSIDFPFLVMFVVALFLAHRAFKRDRLASFALLGAAMGILMNLRIMGVVLFAAVIGMGALDAGLSQGWAERKRALLTGGIFALTSALTAYALLPYLWADPVGRVVEWWTTLSDHPAKVGELFRGASHYSGDLPPEYLLVWFSIAAPPFALLLGLIGAGGVAASGASAGLQALRNTRPRFALMLLGSFIAPFIAVVLLELSMYDTWRHMYFLWAPFSLLAAFGAQRLARALRRARWRGAVYGALGLGLGATVVSMASIHPNQQDYFNFFVDRATPEHLRAQYKLDVWGNSTRQGLEWVLQSHASGVVNVSGDVHVRDSLGILKERDRERLAWTPTLDAFAGKRPGDPREPALHRVKVYGSTLWVIGRKEGLRTLYEATRDREPIIDSPYDIYRSGEVWALVKEPCAPAFITHGFLTMRITPVDRRDLPYWLRDEGFEARRFYLPQHAAYFDGKCVGSLPMPDYPIAGISIASAPEVISEEEGREWMRRASEEGQLLARSAYDLHLTGRELVYIRQACDPLETEHLFYLNVALEDKGGSLGEHGASVYRSFDFHRRGAFVDGACLARVSLPDRPIRGIRTGQTAEGEGDLWSAAFSLNQERYRAVYESALPSDPVARGVFDIRLADGAIVYGKESCEQSDTEARFFLHVVPDIEEDLPEEALSAQFENRDFHFYLNGALFDGKCAARVPLPDYAIAGIRTGQRGEDSGELWSAAFSLNPERYRAVYESALLSEPVARGVFDVRLTDGALVYVRERCGPADTEARFFLHFVPERAGDLPEERRDVGFDNLDFDFFTRGAAFDGKCAARVPLPDYEVALVRTGQFARGEETEIWKAEFEVGFPPTRE